LLAADAYGVYIEVRKVGTVFDANETKAALGAAALLDNEAAELLQLANFISENSEALAESRVVVTLLPAAPRLPQALVGVQLASPEAARAFEPKFRAFVDEQRRSRTVAESGPSRSASRRRAPRASKPKAAPASSIALRRVGSWLIAAETPFTLKRLAGDGNSLADSARFQNLRTRFVNESLFVYFDTERTQQSWTLMTQQTQEEAMLEMETSGTRPVEPPYDVELSVEAPTVVAGDASSSVQTLPPPEVIGLGRPGSPQQTPTPNPEGEPTIETTPEPTLSPEAAVAVGTSTVASDEVRNPATPPSQEQLAYRSLNGLLGGLWGGLPRLPGAVAAGVGVEGGMVAIRLAVENTPDGAISLIPFLPNLIAGAPVSVEASAFAPASNDILFTTTLDWTQIFNSLLGTARQQGVLRNANLSTDHGGEENSAVEAERSLTPDEALLSIEKLLGFKLRDDFLPALGNEVAISIPLETFQSPIRSRRAAPGDKGEDPQAAKPDFVALIALNNPEAMREMMPRLSLLLGMASGGTAQALTEKREGHEIRVIGQFAYAILGRFMVVGEHVGAVRHVIDSYARGDTLANQSGYRDSTSWQAHQRLAHAYVSDALMRNTIRDMKRLVDGSSDPIVLSTLPQLDLPPEAISFATTNEGDVLVHELRLPVNLGRVYAAAAVIQAREGSNITAEAMATYAMQTIYQGQETYKTDGKRGRYGSLEELLAEKVVDKSSLPQSYRIEVNASGDHFEATATPKEYGKTGRRSFYMDQTGVLRAADHKGRPATAQDPPADHVDQWD
jgi:hypothetical protein